MGRPESVQAQIDRDDPADALARTTRSLGDAALRVAYFRDVLASTPLAPLARTLDILCARAEQAEEPARDALMALVDAMNQHDSFDIVRRLREEATGSSLLALGRLIRQPLLAARNALTAEANEAQQTRPPDYGAGRPLTLGERKSLARRPDRASLDRLLFDPHPDVIRSLLRNPRLTEDDVLRLAARRPNRPEVLAEIARCPRWLHRSRVRLAIVLNPSAAPEVAGPLTGLLVRQELKLVIGATHVAPALRALCLERLDRRPPTVLQASKRMQ